MGNNVIKKADFIINNIKIDRTFNYQNKNNNNEPIDTIDIINIDNNTSLLAKADLEYLDNNTTVVSEDIDNYFRECLEAKYGMWYPELNEREKKEVYMGLSPEESDKLIYYFANIYNKYNGEQDINQMLEESRCLMELDKNNNNYILYHTPKLINGNIKKSLWIKDSEWDNLNYNGEYLEYYNEDDTSVTVPLSIITRDSKGNIISIPMDENTKDNYIKNINNYYYDIMNNYTNYSKKFKKVTGNSLQNVDILYFDTSNVDPDYGAYTTGISAETMVIRGECITTSLGYNYMINAYTHELGHVYGYNYNKIDESREWQNIWKQINENDIDYTFLSDYAHSSYIEGFAECVAEYFSNGFDPRYNPNDLKAIEIDYNGYTNLYDYMRDILSRKTIVKEDNSYEYTYE